MNRETRWMLAVLVAFAGGTAFGAMSGWPSLWFGLIVAGAIGLIVPPKEDAAKCQRWHDSEVVEPVARVRRAWMETAGCSGATNATPTDTERLNVLESLLQNNGLDYTERHGGFSIKWGNPGFFLEPVATLREKADQLIAAGAV